MHTTITTERPQEAAEPRKPWHRRPIALLAAGAALLTAAGLGLGLALGLHGGASNIRPTGMRAGLPVSVSGAAGIVQGDGYTITQRLSPADIKAMLAADKDPGDQMFITMVNPNVEAVAGTKGSQEEAAVRLSASGKALITSLMPLIQAGPKGMTVRVVGDYLVVTGSASDFAASGGAFGSLGGK
jgi:hypothetical protein